MHEGGVTFGAHGYTHLDLTALSVKECTAELKMSREYLEDLLGESVTRLAYPRGRHNASVREAARRAGFLTSYALPISREPGGLMAVPRVGVYAGNGTWAIHIKSSKRYLDVRTHPVIGRLGGSSWRTEPALDDPRLTP
jgi:peptidoglycan/xylan/chitin deacetylase (PgdA/CDA1 family)